MERGTDPVHAARETRSVSALFIAEKWGEDGVGGRTIFKTQPDRADYATKSELVAYNQPVLINSSVAKTNFCNFEHSPKKILFACELFRGFLNYTPTQ